MTTRKITPPELQNYYDNWHMSPGIACGDFLFLTGMTGVRNDETISTNPEEQIRDAFKKIESILGEAGGNFSHVIEMTTYHVGLREHIDLFRSIRDEFVVEPYPAWTAIEVSGFITDGAIVEIRVVAHLPLKVR